MLPFAVLINTKKSVPDFPRASVVDSLPPDGLALRCAKANLELTSAFGAERKCMSGALTRSDGV
jgi:hypothetical protein